MVKPSRLPEATPADRSAWVGGYIRRDSKGRATYYIRAMRGGVRYDLSTRAHDERSAHDHLRRFDTNPEEYARWLRGATTEGDTTPIYLDKPLRDEFLEWSAKPKSEGGKQNTPEWIRYQRRELEWWAVRLADKAGQALDLREVKREDVFRVLDGDPRAGIPKAGGMRKKQAVLKSLYGWLRRHRRGERIGPTEDPLADVPNLPGGVAQANGVNKYVPPENVHQVIDALVTKGSLYGHALCVQAGTGWHVRELLRFVAGGRVDPVPSYVREPGVTAVLVGPKHKSGKEHITKVGRTVEQSARILLGGEAEGGVPEIDGRARSHRGTGAVRGSISESHYVKAVRQTCKDLKLPVFNPAWMRHTNATHAVQAGARDKVPGFLGHAEGSRMVDIHYATKAIPPKAPTIMDETDPGVGKDQVALLRAKVEALEAELRKSKPKRKG
ncbi:MAG: site-specific integrase [Anaeromyxobacteraceae bacterium]